MLKNPCYGCKYRNAECHALCTEYIDFAKNNAEQREKRYSEVDLYKSDSRLIQRNKTQHKR